MDSEDGAFRGFWSSVVKWFKKIVCWVVNIAIKVFVCIPVAGLAAGAVASISDPNSSAPGLMFNTVQQSCYWATNYVTTKICG